MSTPRRLESDGKPLLAILISLLIFSLPFCKKNSEDNMFLMLTALSSGQAANPTNPGGVITPQFNPTAGTYSADQAVTITSSTSGATIYYTIDGTTPTAASATYSAPISVAGDGATMTIQAIAVKAGMTESTVATADYTINYAQVSTPQFSPAAGTYSADQAVTITTSTPGATIHYTTNGTAPTTASATYTTPITVAGDGTSVTIKAIAVKAGMTDSTVASGGYTIHYPPAQPMGVTATGGNRQITLSWTAVSGATSYNLYWSTAPGVTVGNGTKVPGVTLPYTHTGRTNGTDYHYIVTAADAAGEGQASAEATAYPYLSPLKSNQTQCWDAAGALIACAGTGQDGEYQAGRAADFTGPIQHGTYLSDYTTADNATGLVWKTCIEGLSGANCASGAASLASWDTAITTTCSALNGANAGAGYAGRTDWRLPTISEIETIVNVSAIGPATFVSNFPATSSFYYWSASTYAPDTTAAWRMDFFYGVAGGWGKIIGYMTRCVSGTYISEPIYTDNGNGTVTDKRTGLIWQKCGFGRNDDAVCSDNTGVADIDTWVSALNYCNGLTLGGRTDWRLPNVNELKSMADRTRNNPAIDTTFFPATSSSYYWSATTNSGSVAWIFDFGVGAGGSWNGKTATYPVRCVATGP